MTWFAYLSLVEKLCSMDKEKRRETYRVDFIPLEKIPVWSPSGEQNTLKHSSCIIIIQKENLFVLILNQFNLFGVQKFLE